MKATKELKVHNPSKIFFRLTIFGSLLIGSVYAFLMLFNMAVKVFE